MKSLRFQSVFDIIGPVMIGPSSSHTAGAVRIGKIVSSIFDDTPTEVEFQLFNSFAKTYRGHGTDLALVAGLVEVPCVKRNAMGASFAFIAADMALAGIESKIPVDEVIDAMYQVGASMPTAFRETAEGGLATTPTGRRLQKEIFGE
ncbi:TPA: L-serine ammonia-lyase, iron-sulfur-dependent, subunit alpha [Streptococcus pneumoniae]